MDGGRSQSGASPMVGKRVELDDETWVFVWQDYDLAPTFPSLRKFLDYWQKELDGPLRSVRIAHKRLIKPSEWQAVDGIIQVH
jgi:uncharacterized protein Usg